jgi:hypothetical protein
MTNDILTKVEHELLGWPGVSTEPGRFASQTFLYGRREIGHVHRNGVADLPFPRAVHDELIAAGRAEPHQAGVAGFVSYPIRRPEDVPDAIALFRLNYDRVKEIAARRAASAPPAADGE